MNWCALLLTASIGFIYEFVSASSDEPNDKTLILKAVVHNLPKACKELNGRGCFDALSEKSYDCLFEEKFDTKKASIVMALLMQRGDEKMVQEIAQKWVSKRNWGPFSQLEIAHELMSVISTKTSVGISENKRTKIDLKLKSIYDTFKVLIKSGNELIVANQIYSNVAAKALNLAFKVDKEDKEFAATSSIILDNFYSVKENNSATVDNVKLTQAWYAVRSLNHLAEKKTIEIEAWEVYGPFICTKLNSIFGTEFAMIERDAKEKKSSKNRSYNSSSSSESDEDEKKEGKDAGNKESVVKAKQIKLIELMNKTSTNTKNIVTAQSFSSAITYETFIRIIIGGSTLLLLVSAYAIYRFLSKRRKESSELSDL